ncbi:PAS domain-containing sensor histidine kinase [Noviherbaspirillum aridicola]|uniref:histidine kinase n=1 Tax=Noviherbaspirillum aridicola TaxID=2849687 RepID=A0ABQ4PYT9_9BURK|nr:PAS domain-containing sensor histidine kinase [Noviherbaspirillum aridicola]GIZ50043.1 histidine kinase [Noviherbaspirillum aridicola]
MNNPEPRVHLLLQDGRRFQTLIDNVQDFALYLLDHEGRISSWNAGAERIEGYPADEIIGRSMSLFLAPEDRASGTLEQALASAAGQGRHEMEGWHVRKDGSRFWAHTVLQAIRDDDGQLAGYASIARDITQRKLAGETLERASARLLQAQRLEAVGQLTGGIAHDFNNALSVIVNSLDLLASRLRSASDIVVLEKAQRASERAADLTRQLLAFARRQALAPERLDLNALIASAEPMLRRACGPSVRLAVAPGAEPRMVSVDSQQLLQALLNLVINAREAMPHGGELAIRCDSVVLAERHAAANLLPGSYATVSVSDTGIGLPPDLVPRAIEPFFTTKQDGSSGLGLSQAYGFAAQSGGGMIIDSAVGKGTSVTMYFPLAPAATDKPPVASVAGRAGKVLIVEDDQDVLDLATRIFQSLGFDVLTAGNGLDGVAVLERVRDIDVLFTDVVMPMGMSGIELARFTRKVCPQVRILLASGYPMEVLRAEYGDLDDFAFIGKPFRWTELLEKIRAVQEAA